MSGRVRPAAAADRRAPDVGKSLTNKKGPSAKSCKKRRREGERGQSGQHNRGDRHRHTLLFLSVVPPSLDLLPSSKRKLISAKSSPNETSLFLCFRLPPPHLPPPTERAAFQSFPLHYRRRTWRLAGSLTLAASRATIISPPASNIHQSRYSPHFFVCRHINTNYFRVLTMPSASYRSGGG